MSKEEWKIEIRFAAICICICMICFMLLIANGLTNTYDGMWFGAYYDGYDWVIRTGRWFWPLIGVLKTNKSPEPFTSVISIIIFCIGGCIVTYWFETRYLIKRYIVVLLTVINTAVCAMLSYRFMSITFAVSYIFSILSVFILRRPDWKRCLISIALLTMSLGCYQVNLGCACVIVVLWCVKMILDSRDYKEIVRFILYVAISIIISCIVYKVIWDLVLKIFSLKASAYRGADRISLWNMIVSLPKSVFSAYRAYGKYYFEEGIRHNVFQSYFIYKVPFVLFWTITIIKLFMKNRKEITRSFLACAFLALIPLASNVYMLMAVDAGDIMIQMTLPMVISIPFMLCITDEKIFEKNFMNYIKHNIAVMIVLFLLIGNWMMVSVDQQIMLNGRLASINLMNRIASNIDWDNEPKDGYVFLGRLSENPSFMKEDIWKKANSYAQYGNIPTVGDCCTQSYRGLLRDSGIKLNLNKNDKKWHKLEEMDVVKDMPVFPHEGCMKMIDDSVVIKVSEF